MHRSNLSEIGIGVDLSDDSIDYRELGILVRRERIAKQLGITVYRL